MKEINVEAKLIENGIELRISGDLNFYDSKDFMFEIPEKVKDKGRHVVFNLENLNFIDSAGLGAVLYVSEACRMQYQVLKIINANGAIKKLLQRIQGVGTFEM